MEDHEEFREVLRALIAGDILIESAHNEFVGHTDVVARLLEVAPAEIRADFEYLHALLRDCVEETAAGVLGIFPRLQDPELAAVEGRIADFIADTCGIRYGDGYYHAGKIVRAHAWPGWPGVGSPLTNNRFPYLIDTSASNYFSTRFWNGAQGPPGFVAIPEGGKAVFRGEYPFSRYFAFHPSDFDTNTYPSLLDEKLQPDPGSMNPFAGPVDESANRRFSAQITFTATPDDPADHEPNTCYASTTRLGKPNQAVFVIYRTTGSELGALPPNNTGVLLPSITVYDADGSEVAHYDEIEPYTRGMALPVETTQFAPLPIPDHRGLLWPEKFVTKSNWGLDYDLLASDDILYLVSPYTDRLGEVFVTRAKAFTAPDTPREPVYTPGKDVRGWTVTTYNFWAGVCNSALIDNEIPSDDEGCFTLVVSTAENRPANAVPENGVAWLDWGPYMDGQLTFRMLVRRNPKLAALKKAIDSGQATPEIAPYVPRAVHCSKALFEKGGWQAAFSARENE
jgi:hypothetical protein